MVLILLSCLARHEPVRAESPAPLDLVLASATVVDPAVVAGTPTLAEALHDVVNERNLVPTDVSADLAKFATTRDTRRRIELLAPARATLLVETETAYYSELSGRFRWTVHTTLSLEPAGLSDSFDVPVFLQFAHEKEAEAVSAAAPTIARRAGELLDGWLSAP